MMTKLTSILAGARAAEQLRDIRAKDAREPCELCGLVRGDSGTDESDPGRVLHPS